MANESEQQHKQRPSAWTCIGRALKLRCPECGISPIFRDVKTTRSLFDWFTPLDGCPRCGYAYEREDGYFLLATWAINYGMIAGIGMIVSLLLEHYHPLTLWQYIVYVFTPLPVMAFLFARHSKALYLALDHWVDPHVKEVK